MLAVTHNRVFSIAVAICLSLVVAGCGDNGEGGEETVYLYITNAYPGVSQLTLYGPTGTLVSGLPFGARTEQPVEVNRNVNSTNFTLVLDGAPAQMEFDKPLFSLYPQETGTLVISRRAAENSADATLYRHIRTPDPDCVMIFGNSLSLDNNLMADELLTYSYQTEWNVDPEPMYDPAGEEFATTRCGYTPVPEQYQRDQIHADIQADPWFYPVTGDQNDYTLVWAERRPDPRSGEMRSEGLGVGGQISAQPPTEDFIDCLSSAVSVEQEQDSADTQEDQECPTPEGSQTGPDGGTVLSNDQVVWNAEAAQSCFDLFTYTGFPIEPGQPDSFEAFEMRPRTNVDPDDPEALMCGSKVRIRTPVQDLIFREMDDGSEDFIEVDATFPASEQRFFVLFGRPVNAFIDQWNGEETSISLDEFPYPGNIAPSYGNGSD